MVEGRQIRPRQVLLRLRERREDVSGKEHQLDGNKQADTDPLSFDLELAEQQGVWKETCMQVTILRNPRDYLRLFRRC